MAGLSAFDGAQQSADAQKASLLGLIAQQGTRGLAAYQAQQADAQAAQKAAVQAVAGQSGQALHTSAGPQAALADIAAQAAMPGTTYAADAGAGAQAYQQDIGRISAGNAAYMDQVKAGTPIVEATTRGTVEQILADLADKRAQREADAQQREFDAQQRQATAAEDALARQHEQEGWKHDETGWKHDETIQSQKDWITNTEQAQGKVAAQAEINAAPGVSSIVQDVTKVANNLPDAIKYAQKVAEDYIGKQISSDPSLKDASEADIQAAGNKAYDEILPKVSRWLYNYYQLKQPKKGRNNFLKQLNESGVDYQKAGIKYGGPLVEYDNHGNVIATTDRRTGKRTPVNGAPQPKRKSGNSILKSLLGSVG